jgi:hypothetical protein
MKSINEMSRKDFESVPDRENWNSKIEFRSMVILPQRTKHDSGYACMDFVAVDKNDFPICRLSGCSDVIHFDGISGMKWNGNGFENFPKSSAWSIDCLFKSKLLRVFSRANITCGPSLSSFEIYAKDIEP